MKKLDISEIQKIEFNILQNIADICDKLNIRYYLVFGTLLGAVRHKGFIPWDDDLDIMMPRNDYQKLIDYFNNNAKDVYPLRAVYVFGDKWPFAMARITDMTTKLVFQSHGPYSTEDMGVFIDIYPFDGICDEKETAIKKSKKSRRLIVCAWLALTKIHTKRNNKIKDVLSIIAEKMFKIIGADFFLGRLRSLSINNEYDASRYVGGLGWHTDISVFDRADFGKPVKVNFNGKEFNAPSNIKKLLIESYGDYMNLPPEEERHASHYYEAYYRGDNS